MDIGWATYETCSRCDYTTYQEIKALGHDYEENVIAPTSTTTGYTLYTCIRCQDSYKDNETPILGNINGDGDTDLNDVEALFQYISGQGGEVNTAAADVNGDGMIDLKDVTRLYQFLSGQISSLD
jgi:hypothetical protein